MLIQEDDLHRFASAVENAFQIAKRHEAVVVANVGGLIQLGVGPRRDSEDCAAHRIAISRELANSLRTSARIIHGKGQSYVGTVGTENRRNWGFYPNSFVEILQSLLGAIPGEPLEMQQHGQHGTAFP